MAATDQQNASQQTPATQSQTGQQPSNTTNPEWLKYMTDENAGAQTAANAISSALGVGQQPPAAAQNTIPVTNPANPASTAGAQTGEMSTDQAAMDSLMQQINASLAAQPDNTQANNPSASQATSTNSQQTGAAQSDMTADQFLAALMAAGTGADYQGVDYFAQAASSIQNAISAKKARNDITGQDEALAIDSITIGRQGGRGSVDGFVIFGSDSDNENMTLHLKMPRALEYNAQSFNTAISAALMEQFATIKLNDGTTLADHLKTSDNPYYKDNVAKLQTDLQAVVQQGSMLNPPLFTDAEKAILTNWTGFNPDNNVNHFSSVNVDDKGRASICFNLDDYNGNIEKDLGVTGNGQSLASMIKDNIDARRQDIRQMIFDKANALNQQQIAAGNPPVFNAEQIDQLFNRQNFVVSAGQWSDGKSESITVTVGTQLNERQGDRPEDILGETPLSKLLGDTLHQILLDSVLAGRGAEQVAPIIADAGDIRTILTEKQQALQQSGQASPAIAAVIGNPVLQSRDRDKERPTLEINEPYASELYPGLYEMHIKVPLPVNTKVTDVIAQIDGVKQGRGAMPGMPADAQALQAQADQQAMHQLTGQHQHGKQHQDKHHQGKDHKGDKGHKDVANNQAAQSQQGGNPAPQQPAAAAPSTGLDAVIAAQQNPASQQR